MEIIMVIQTSSAFIFAFTLLSPHNSSLYKLLMVTCLEPVLFMAISFVVKQMAILQTPTQAYLTPSID